MSNNRQVEIRQCRLASRMDVVPGGCVWRKIYGQATKGVRVDALAQAGDEGRGQLR